MKLCIWKRLLSVKFSELDGKKILDMQSNERFRMNFQNYRTLRSSNAERHNISFNEHVL